MVNESNIYDSMTSTLKDLHNYAEMNDFAQRLVIGSEGGLALRLFDEKIPGTYEPFPTQFQVTNPLDREALNIYFNHVIQYVDDAHLLARRHSFGMKRIPSNSDLILPWSNWTAPYQEAAIGITEVLVLDEILRFRDMITIQKDVLSDSYNKISKKALRFIH